MGKHRSQTTTDTPATLSQLAYEARHREGMPAWRMARMSVAPLWDLRPSVCILCALGNHDH